MATKRKTAANKQRENNGEGHDGRNQGGRFAEGNPHAFKPGQSGNPAGRPKSITLSEAYRKALARPYPDDPEGRTYAEVIADKVVEAAAKGLKYDMSMARELADRLEGKPRAQLEIDLHAMDWRDQAREFGLSIDDVINETKRLIDAAIAGRDAQLDDQEARG